MLVNYLLAIGLVMILLVGWCTVQNWARNYARRHPEFGPAREDGGGCGLSCQCTNSDDKSKCQHKNKCE